METYLRQSTVDPLREGKLLGIFYGLFGLIFASIVLWFIHRGDIPLEFATPIDKVAGAFGLMTLCVPFLFAKICLSIQPVIKITIADDTISFEKTDKTITTIPWNTILDVSKTISMGRYSRGNIVQNSILVVYRDPQGKKCRIGGSEPAWIQQENHRVVTGEALRETLRKLWRTKIRKTP